MHLAHLRRIDAKRDVLDRKGCGSLSSRHVTLIYRVACYVGRAWVNLRAPEWVGPGNIGHRRNGPIPASISAA
jgi:hypothetical protein